MKVEVFAGIDVPERTALPLKLIVKVCAEPEVFAATMLVTTATAPDPDGAVYSVVLLVAAAVFAICLDVVAISYYLS